jgi:hypothetical protein
MRYQDPGSVFQTSASPGCPVGSYPVTPDLVYGSKATAPRTGRSIASTSTAGAPISATRNRSGAFLAWPAGPRHSLVCGIA